MDFTTFVYIGSILGFLFGVSLIFNRRVRSTDLTLIAALLVTLSVAMAVIVAEHENLLPIRAYLLMAIEYAISLASGPLLYLYVRSKREGGYLYRRRDPLHFIPMLVISIAMVLQIGPPIPFRVVMIHQMVYTAICLFFVTSRPRAFKAQDSLRLYWPRRFVMVALMIHAAQIVRTLFFDVVALRNIVPVTGVTSLFVMSIIAFRRAILESIARSGSLEDKYSRSSLDDESADEIASNLERAMRDDRLYSNPDLALDALARAIETSPHSLSQVLNARLGVTFFEYLAEFRLEDATRRLADPENDQFTIDAIAEAAGFSSRSTFYAAFRKTHHMTPTAYRKRIRSGT